MEAKGLNKSSFLHPYLVMMMIPNLIGVVVLSPVLIKIVRNYVDRKIKGKVVTPMLSYDEEIQKVMEEAVNNGEE